MKLDITEEWLLSFDDEDDEFPSLPTRLDRFSVRENYWGVYEISLIASKPYANHVEVIPHNASSEASEPLTKVAHLTGIASIPGNLSVTPVVYAEIPKSIRPVPDTYLASHGVPAIGITKSGESSGIFKTEYQPLFHPYYCIA